jgi:hypothetical protein
VSEEAEDTEEPREISEWRDSLMLEEGIGRVLLDRLAAFDAATPEASEEDVMGVIVVRRWLEQDLLPYEMDALRLRSNRPDSAI